MIYTSPSTCDSMLLRVAVLTVRQIQMDGNRKCIVLSQPDVVYFRHCQGSGDDQRNRGQGRLARTGNLWRGLLSLVPS